ncbi:polycystin-1-like protein 1 [Petromyzon marinus]|uniref:polycystin-1-like protein 1 n=1 Tax=Petromyzon marinus TaxID=7757 RepID=UPI003F716243
MVRRRPLVLAVSLEDEKVDCVTSQLLLFNWTVVDKDGSALALPPSVATNNRGLVIPANTLSYGNYTVATKVRIAGTIVYAVYAVSVVVEPSPLVSIISGGTRVFLTRQQHVLLDGSRSLDPDDPEDSTDLRRVGSLPPPCPPYFGLIQGGPVKLFCEQRIVSFMKTTFSHILQDCNVT